MRRLLIIAFLAVAGLLGGTASASAFSAVDVHVENRGPCHYVVVNGKDVPQNGLCYLGPPPIN